MKTHHHGGTVVHQRQVFAQPLHLIVGDGASVVATAGDAFAIGLVIVGDIQVLDVVKHHIVYLAQVEAVVVGAHDFTPCRNGFNIGVGSCRHAGVMVVVADNGPQCHRVVEVCHIVHEVAQVVIVLSPEHIPGEVAEQDGIDGCAGRAFYLIVKTGDESFLEVGAIAVAACQMGVGSKIS